MLKLMPELDQAFQSLRTPPFYLLERKIFACHKFFKLVCLLFVRRRCRHFVNFDEKCLETDSTENLQVFVKFLTNIRRQIYNCICLIKSANSVAQISRMSLSLIGQNRATDQSEIFVLCQSERGKLTHNIILQDLSWSIYVRFLTERKSRDAIRR